MLAEIGMSSFALDDGSTVEVKQTYGASILVDKRPEAYDGYAIMGTMTLLKILSCVSLAVERTIKRVPLLLLRKSKGLFPEQKTEVHPQTLRAFVKERCEAGEDFPMELFGAWVGQRAVIKRGKKK